MKIFTKDSHRWSLADMCWFLGNINTQMLNMLAILHLENKLSPTGPYPPNEGMPVCLPLRLQSLLLPLDPSPPLGCHPVILSNPGHPIQQTGRVGLGCCHTEVSPKASQDGASLLTGTLSPPCKTPSSQLKVSQNIQESMQIKISKLKNKSFRIVLFTRKTSSIKIKHLFKYSKLDQNLINFLSNFRNNLLLYR